MGEGMSKRLKVQLGGEAEMEERAFNNPYPDYSPHGAAASAASVAPSSPSDEEGKRCRSASPQRDDSLPFDSDGKISPSFNKRITTKIKDLLQQMEEGLKTADPHDCSAYTGWTGIALLYLQLYHVTKEQSHLQRSLDYVKRILRNLNGRRVTFLCGDAGPLAVGAVVYHKLKNDSESKECVTKLLQLQRIVIATDSDLPDELLYGRAGYLYALLYLNTEIGPETVPQSVIKEVVDVIIESGKNFSREERKTERCPLLYQWHRKQYVGAAHGVSGIYYMLMQPASNVDQEILTELVKPSIDYVRHKKFRSGNYPSSLSNETDRLVHWCHGAPGVIHMLMQAYKIFKEDKYLKDAMECSDVIWQRGLLRKGYGICHGTAGNGYSFLSLYHLTLDKKYLYRACKFAEWCLEYGAHGCRIPDRPYSLFEGMAGAIHFLSDILVPEKSRFPAFELTPPRKENKEECNS
ncbi:lanC-like protein 2 isoform X1 [Varanus komodoensis]|uniref:LanC-like protein 2 n=1 Tax=Varanus komodoensis TaxID=61221 RepID=A0A8D2L4B1_VARKO|nr:lanC-like protein 2 isoform X1 [Varanus komodoensis]